MLAAACALVLAQATQAEPAPSALERHALGAERIVIGHVVDVAPLVSEGAGAAVQLAVVDVKRVLLGPEDLRRMVVLAADAGETAAAWESGTPTLFALQPGRVRRPLDAAAKAALDERVGADGLWQVAPDGAWVAGEASAWKPSLPEALTAGDATPDLAEIVAWLDTELDRVTPAFSAEVLSTGPYRYGLSVASDGAWKLVGDHPRIPESAPREGAVDADSFQTALDPERFRSHPAAIGRSPGPDSSWLAVRMRTRLGVTELRVWEVPEAEEAAETVAARAHLARIFAASSTDSAPIDRFLR